MGLDAHVYCRCIEDGKAKAHPFAKLLKFDPINGAYLKKGATDEQLEAHDKWFDRSCCHEGYAAAERLGNMSWIAEVREILEVCEDSSKNFPVLLGKVVYSGTHCGDHLPMRDVLKLQKEIAKAKKIRLPNPTSNLFKDFVRSIEKLCKTSIKTGYPIVF